MAQAEGSFKVCGLCSQLVDESVKLPDDLLNHLIVFLNVAGDLLPSKICTDCFQGATESKKFKVGTYLKAPVRPDHIGRRVVPLNRPRLRVFLARGL
jgi:hypothetical protein